jgi:hypothetical protein
MVNKKNNRSNVKDVLIKVENYGQEERKAQLSLSIGNKEVTKRAIVVSSQDEMVVEFTNVRFPTREAHGSIELKTENENIAIDDRHYFVSSSSEEAKILAVNGEPDSRDDIKDELFYLDRALNLPGVRKYKLIQTRPDRLKQHDLSGYQAVIFANVRATGSSLKHLICSLKN